jgi:hypothetical protein
MKTLKLFNAVLAKGSEEKDAFISVDKGFIIESNALWAEDEILSYYAEESLNGNDLNKTFHKSWSVIEGSERFELVSHQIKHYISGYGTNFDSELYIPDEILDVPVKLTYKVVKAYTKDELTEKCLSLLISGIALTEETIQDVLDILDELGYEFTGKEGIRNKEALVMIADLFNVYPEDPVEFFRYVIYKSTDDTLLIKDDELINKIKNSGFDASDLFMEYGLEKMATIFNRFKPLFLAYKKTSPKVINKISKLSKKHHVPLVTNPLNLVTSRLLSIDDNHWLDNATPYVLLKALSACYDRANPGRDTFVYRIRNGKSYAKENASDGTVSYSNYKYLSKYMTERFNMNGLRVFLPDNISYAVPTSEKMFVGNVPTGTKFYGDKLAAGVYWENNWGANDIDLSALNIGGKIGWNADYSKGNLKYSGDITNAPNGAVEYLYAKQGLGAPSLVVSNVYSGMSTAGYKIIVGKGDDVNRAYMMNPNNLIMEVKTEGVQNQMVLGMMIPEEDSQSFVLLNMGSGEVRVSGNSEVSKLYTKALYQQWSRPFSFRSLLDILNVKVVENKEEADYDFSIDNLEKDSFVKFFEDEKKSVFINDNTIV